MTGCIGARISIGRASSFFSGRPNRSCQSFYVAKNEQLGFCNLTSRLLNGA